MKDLRHLRVLVVDCQTTGATPERGDLLELGWQRYRVAEGGPEHTEEARQVPTARLAALPDGQTLPGHIARMTGLKDTDLESSARPIDEIRRDFSAALRHTDVALAHYARFERRFLQDLLNHDASFDLLCTHAVATRLFPGLPRRGLRAMAGYFGHPLPDHKRAGPHVAATAVIWRHLVDELRHGAGVRTLEELREWLEVTPTSRPDRLTYPIDRERRLSLPDRPGVYRMLDANERILYVGKATSLKQRVNSYFQTRRGLSGRKMELVSQVRDLSVTPTATPLEAALRESDAIKEHAPPYNKALRRRERQIWWADRRWRSVRGTRDEDHRVGPLSAETQLDQLGALLAVLESGARDEGMLPRYLQDRQPEFDGDAAAVLLAGATLLAERHGLDSETTPEDLERLGAVLWAKRLADQEAEQEADQETEKEVDQEAEAAREQENPPPDDPQSPEEPAPIDPATLMEMLESALRHGTRRLRKGRWLLRLADANLAWRPAPGHLATSSDETSPETSDEPAEETLRVVQIRGARLEVRRWASPEEADELLAATVAPDAKYDAADFDIDDWDRLSVLTAELRRLVDQADHLRLVTGDGARFDADALASYLRWI